MWLQTWPFELTKSSNRVFNMKQWNIWANSMIAQACNNGDIEDAWEAVRFIFAGRFRNPPDDPDMFDQVRVDVLRSCIEAADYYVSTDVDSAHGFIGPKGPLAITIPFTYIPVVADFKRFNSNIHLTCSIPGTNLCLSPKVIPNIVIGHAGSKNTIYAMFPELRDSLNDTVVPSNVQEEFYNHCIKPALSEVSEGAHQYPADWNTAWDKAYGRGRTCHEHGVDIAPVETENFFDLVRQFASDRTTFGFRNIFFLVEMRGTKGFGRYHLDLPGRRAALKGVLKRFSQDTLTSPENIFYADMGVEISSDDGSVRLKRDALEAVYRYCLPHLTAEGARRLVESSRTTIDAYAHTEQLCGFRSVLLPKSSETFDAVYIQGYYTEKHQTSTLGNLTTFSLIPTEDASPQNIEKLSSTLRKRSGMIYDWLVPPDGSPPHVEGALRLEVRTRLRAAEDYLIDTPTHEQMESWFAVISGGRLL
jgi:hypothetical protein